MKQNKKARITLSEITGSVNEQLRFFALLNLGVAQALAGGVISAAEAIRLFYNAENCFYVRERFRNKHASAIMSRGVQLPDLFEALPADEASREFLRELEMIRSLCTQLLIAKPSTKAAKRLLA
ncbi:hypothetical protein HUU05_16330 [candidate division KSB1 bacterium]|nr:hypothetical protein [candidate division KSB1 bacterium]